MPSIKIRPAAGQPFEKIPIVKGDKPAHQWIGTALQIENPDGTWGEAVDLSGAILVDKGTNPEHTGRKYKIVVIDGQITLEEIV
jgi:hypothetical protein